MYGAQRICLEKSRDQQGAVFYSRTVFVKKKKKKEEDKEKNETKTTIYINTTCFINNTDISQILKTMADKVLDSVQREYKNKINFF